LVVSEKIAGVAEVAGEPGAVGGSECDCFGIGNGEFLSAKKWRVASDEWREKRRTKN
jgi:hypothetical protein